MKRLLLSACAGILALTVAAGPVAFPAGPAHAWTAGAALADDRGIPTLAPVIERVADAVVNIAVVSERPAQMTPLFRDPFFAPFLPPMPPEGPVERQMSAGSGVIVDAERGHVLTNNHVIQDATEIRVSLRDGRSFRAELVGTDPATDIAVLRIPAEGLTAVPTGNSDALLVGDYVVAIGNPFILGQTVTLGIVSALGRSGINPQGYEDFIQTDASINPGNSGGALVTLEGQLIGINTAIIGPNGGNVGIGFAIPSNMAREVMNQLREHGEVRRGQLGVLVQDLTPELAQAFNLKDRQGAVVAQVLPGSPAEKAGVRTGDIVLAVNGRAVHSANALRNAIGMTRRGATVALDILRDGRALKINVKIEAIERQRASTDQPAQAGPTSRRLSGVELGEIERDHPLAGIEQGVQVYSVQAGSPAARAGLREGDIILSIDRKRVRSVKEAEAALKDAGERLLLHVRRGEGALFIVIR